MFVSGVRHPFVAPKTTLMMESAMKLNGHLLHMHGNTTYTFVMHCMHAFWKLQHMALNQ